MRYLMLVCEDETLDYPEYAATMQSEGPAWVQEMDRRGVRRYGHILKDPGTASTVRVRDGEIIVTDGPFTESKEFVAGFDLIECADLDEALEIAAKHPVSWFHSIEVRPFYELDIPGYRAGQPLPAIPEVEQGERFLLLMFVDGIPGPPEVEASILPEGLAWAAELSARGIQQFGQPLQHANTATTVRVRNGETLLTDGPFIETKEFIAGIDIIDCSGREEAIAIAAKHPLARHHMVEVRPFADD